jgi:hypothetical protein
MPKLEVAKRDPFPKPPMDQKLKLEEVLFAPGPIILARLADVVFPVVWDDMNIFLVFASM